MRRLCAGIRLYAVFFTGLVSKTVDEASSVRGRELCTTAHKLLMTTVKNTVQVDSLCCFQSLLSVIVVVAGGGAVGAFHIGPRALKVCASHYFRSPDIFMCAKS